MSLSVTVKVSNIKDLSNARYCAGMGVAYLGFNPNEISGEKAKEISNWITGVQTVLEYGNRPINNLKYDLESYGAALVETSDIETVGYCIQEKIPVAYTGPIEDIHDMDWDQIEYIITDTPSADVTLLNLTNWETFKNLNLSQNENIGLSLKADTEERPGFSNFDTIMDQLEAIEID